MVEAKAVVASKVGLHARPAARFVQEALKHACAISLESNGKRADGKSILQVLALGVKQGQEVVVRADGEGEEDAAKRLVDVLSGPDESAPEANARQS